jgi:hypothetical protein
MVFQFCPNGAIGLQPRVAASATLGDEGTLSSTARRLRLLCAFLAEKNDVTALRLISFFAGSQGSRNGNHWAEGRSPVGTTLKTPDTNELHFDF